MSQCWRWRAGWQWRGRGGWRGLVVGRLSVAPEKPSKKVVSNQTYMNLMNTICQRKWFMLTEEAQCTKTTKMYLGGSFRNRIHRYGVLLGLASCARVRAVVGREGLCECVSQCRRRVTAGVPTQSKLPPQEIIVLDSFITGLETGCSPALFHLKNTRTNMKKKTNQVPTYIYIYIYIYTHTQKKYKKGGNISNKIYTFYVIHLKILYFGVL